MKRAHANADQTPTSRWGWEADAAGVYLPLVCGRLRDPKTRKPRVRSVSQPVVKHVNKRRS